MNMHYTHTGNTTFAAVVGNEDYDTLKEALSPVLLQMNTLLTSPTVEVEGSTHTVEFFLGGDYKVDITFKIIFFQAHACL